MPGTYIYGAEGLTLRDFPGGRPVPATGIIIMATDKVYVSDEFLLLPCRTYRRDSTNLALLIMKPGMPITVTALSIFYLSF